MKAPSVRGGRSAEDGAPTSSPLWMRLQELMMILFSFSTDTTSVMQLGEHEWLMYLSITDAAQGDAHSSAPSNPHTPRWTKAGSEGPDAGSEQQLSLELSMFCWKQLKLMLTAAERRCS